MDNEKLDENPKEITEENTDVVDIEPARKKQSVTLGETITLQAIICVIISIIFIVANMFAPKTAEQLAEEFRENYCTSDEMTDSVLEAFMNFVNSKPVSYD